MAAVTSASFVVLFACSWIFVLCQGTQEVKKKPGEDATLQCKSERGADIELIEWNRTDPKTDDGFVFYLSTDKIKGEYQNSLFQGRVELQDPEMKNGDASVILKNVNISDTGTYECWIAVKNSGRRKRDAPKPISTIKLTVTETLEVKVKPGEDATLQCRGHGGADIEVIKWIRTDLKEDDGFVFFFRDGGSNENDQHESYRGRVELRDPERKNGDASVILKNVTFNDTGTYECQIAVKNSGRRKRAAAEPISTIEVTVTESGHTAGHEEGGDKEGGHKEGGGQERNVGLMVGLPVFAVLLVAVVGTMIFKKHRGSTAHKRGETDSLNPQTSG